MQTLLYTDSNQGIQCDTKEIQSTNQGIQCTMCSKSQLLGISNAAIHYYSTHSSPSQVRYTIQKDFECFKYCYILFCEDYLGFRAQLFPEGNRR